MDTGVGLFEGAPSSRLRVLKHLRNQKAALLKSASVARFGFAATAAEEDVDEDPNKPTPLPPNSMQLYSYYAPSMQGGVYEIEVKHTVAHPTDATQKLALTSTQKFNVNAPRFTLPPGVVHSTYPPQGLGDHNNVLPHIVFNDPHLPWEQEGSPKQDKIDGEEENKEGGKKAKNKIPWIALLTFTENELKLDPEMLKKRSDDGLFPDVVRIAPKTVLPPTVDPVSGKTIDQQMQDREQNKATFVTQLTMGEYLEMGGDDGTKKPPTATVVTPIKDDQDGEKIDRNTQVDVVFLTAKYVRDLFASYDEQGTRKPEVNSPDLSPFAYLSHVRNVNTRNIANAGLDDEGLYSVIHAHRSGPLNLTSPKPIIVHLVSLEGVEENLKFPLDDDTRVAFVSLYSWTYLCLPPDEVNFVDSMRHIGFSIKDDKCWLRTPDEVIDRVGASTRVNGPPTKVTERLVKRMKDGYCLQRYRLHTGEETMAFYRGPLTPCYMPPIKKDWWPYQSNFSTDYQILDPNLGIMDITYSAAWQLGRTLGIANQAFTAALVRLRTTVQTTGRREAFKKVTPQSINTKAETLKSISGSITAIAGFSATAAGEQTHPPEARHSTVNPLQPLTFQKPGGEFVSSKGAIGSFVRKNIAAATVGAGSAHAEPQGFAPMSLAADPAPQPDDELFIPFNEINVPKSADWQLVQSWILDNMFLKNIPAHYLLPDPSYLPPESIRFFYIDDNWMDAFVDGALSIGNHLDRADDVVRQALKRNLNRYFETNYVDQAGSELNYHPQIPCFGFFLRSAVVKAFPDLQIHAPWAKGDNVSGKREPTLRFETIDKDILLCLFDRMPGTAHWDPAEQITLSQPPHQQCFSIGTDLDADFLEVQFPAVYTTNENPPNDERFDPLRIVKWIRGSDKGPVEAPNKGEKDGELPPDLKGVLPKAVFDWDSRMLLFPAFSTASYQVVTHDMIRAVSLKGKPTPPTPAAPASASATPSAPGTVSGDKEKPKPTTMKYFDESVPTSAMVGTVLTSHVHKMKIELPPTTRLYSVEVRFPMGPRRRPLRQPYGGSGGRMLSNPRFNAHCNVERDAKGQETLVFTLIPRTTALVPLRNIGEVSFVVNQARLSGVGGKGFVSVVVHENYRRQNEDEKGVVKGFVHHALAGVVVEKVLA
ncbi:hypothetical protein NEMBOFW57_004584 [Staphylotrichum longicolle]|uniref:Uncharacterized protein n=1 Tax=Staphylotrichum longicolle TaxID=669026 RepID=A0AAD4F7E2_9PEZI|nr:hypothetical protein NEMBOFW57_004584 [Staphylotrichum longicolle]